MTSEEKLKRLFSLFLRTVQSDEKLLTAVEEILAGDLAPAEPAKKRAKNRRNAALFDPFLIYQEGESVLTGRLGSLNIEELRDIVAEFGMDPAKLALKWKSTERLAEHILTTVKTRMTKGDAFRS
jgi:hypothetical protein